MLNWLQSGGLILWLILLFGFILYWQLFDLLLQLRCPAGRCCWQCRHHKCLQLMAWVSVAPLLGLLGTVNGLLNSFSMMAKGSNELLHIGMSQALLTTEIGLAVAIPAWILLLLSERFSHARMELCQ